MAFFCLAAVSRKKIQINDFDSVNVSFPNFLEVIDKLKTYKHKQIVVCADGTSASGKTSILNKVTKQLGSKAFTLDTGKIYRFITKLHLESGHKKINTKHLINKSKNILKAVGNYVYQNLKSNKILINEPQGGFYLMPEFLNSKFKTSSEMCGDILNNTGVALLPGSDFGFNPDKMLARLSFTDFDGQEFMNNIDETKKIDENLIKKFAPKVVEGVNKLKNWSETL